MKHVGIFMLLPVLAFTVTARAQQPPPPRVVDLKASDGTRTGEPKLAVEVLELVLLAYSESADAHETLAEAYLGKRTERFGTAACRKGLGPVGFSCATSVLMDRYRAIPR
jgi:hypothetical protein